MPATLCILGCHNYQQEVAAAIAAEGWNDVVSRAFPARCGRPPLAWDELRAVLPEACTQVLVLGRACLAGLGEAPAGFPAVRLLPQGECFHMVAGASLVAEAIAGGAYLMSPGWLADWRGRLAEMGFAPEAAKEFFGDFARELVLFDTGIDPQSQARLAEMAATLGLPAKRLTVGLDQIRLLLTRAVLEWRLDEEHRARLAHDRHHARELADHVSAMDLLARLVKTRSEDEAIAAIEELFRMLFAPATWHYLRIDRKQPGNGVEREAESDAERLPPELRAALQQMTATYAWTPSGRGFMLRIARGELLLGWVVADDLALPEYRERYLNMALAMTGVCALTIESARTRKQLVEAEKMASLGIMVAGVAHEINTPVGVGLTAASTLQGQAQNIARRFAERQMTQSDLQGFLASAVSEAVLIRGNLERIGQLTEAFRQVAVDGKPLASSRFRIKECLNDVIASLGKRLDTERYTVHVAGDEHLEIDSHPGDWASIFTNLIANSLQHGFKGRDHGHIEIALDNSDGPLKVDYTDDGIGITPEVRARIFDPFFTTDLQHGMGLGMYLVYNLVTHRLGGAIACHSEPGAGMHIHIETPP